ncbi:EpsG family protein [Pseudoalteromonas marina]|uniref:EpsG family protein n=1 Tax=Pseudoalteromonas marina TaxID=267375 RepID=A0ABT9FDF1_9GAMM|nr:EpsG family protein [Pseudoalteromonas marina]MDP2564799.1 EpsG family protein [Pseudoalteromonas marina]
MTTLSLLAIKSSLLFTLFISETNFRAIGFLLITSVFIVLGYVNYTGLSISHDTVTYYIPFYNNSGWREFEPGYTLLNQLSKKAGLSADSFIFCISYGTLFFFFISLWKIAKDLSAFVLIIYLVFCTLSFNFLSTGLLRQYLALVLIFLGSSFLVNEKRVQFLVCVFIASTIHFSSIIYLLVLFFVKFEMKKKLIVIFLSFIFSIFSKDIILFFLNNIPLFDDNVYVKSVVRGLGYSDKNSIHNNYFFKYFFVFLSLFLIGLISLFLELKDKYRQRFDIIYSFSLCGFFVASLIFFSSEASIRVLYGVVIFSCVCFGVLLKFSNFKSSSLLVTAVGLMFYLYSFVSHNWIVDFVNRYI